MFFLQYSRGQLVEGMEQAKLGIISDPISSYAYAIYGMTCAAAGRHAESVRASQRALEMDPESFIAHIAHLFDLCVSSRFEEAAAHGELALAMSGRHPWAMAVLAVTFGDWGKRAEAESVYAELAARARRSYVQPSTLALAASAAGFEDQAICHAREAFEIRDPMALMYFSSSWPGSARLRSYPRFHTCAVDTGWLLK